MSSKKVTGLVVSLTVLMVLGAIGWTGATTLQAYEAAAPGTAATPSVTPNAKPTPGSPAAGRQAQTGPATLPATLRALGLEGGVVMTRTADSLTLRVGRVTDTIKIGVNTLVIMPGTPNATLLDIRVRDRVLASVSKSDPNAAAGLVLNLPLALSKDNFALGVVESRTQNFMIIRVRGGANRAVAVGNSTVVVSLLQDNTARGKFSDVKRGSTVLVLGKPENGGRALGARVIFLLDRTALTPNGNRPSPTPTATPKP